MLPLDDVEDRSQSEEEEKPKKVSVNYFQRQINLDVFQEGIKKFIVNRLPTVAAAKRCEETFDRS